MLTFADFNRLLARAESVLDRLEAMLPPAPPPPDWRASAFRWRKRAGRGYLQPIAHPHVIRLDDLVAIDDQKRAIDQNTRQFVAGLPANNVLLTGSRGTGKSSLVKAMLSKYAAKGLRVIEVDKTDLVEPPAPAARILQREPRDEARRRRGASGRVGRGEDLAVRAIRNVDLVLPVQPGRLSRGGRRLARGVRRQGGELRTRARGARARGAAVRVAARLAQRPRCVAVRAQLRGRLRAAQERQTDVTDEIVHVAAAVILRPDGQVLLAQRPLGKVYAGYWEFPGGKLEPGESRSEEH